MKFHLVFFRPSSPPQSQPAPRDLPIHRSPSNPSVQRRVPAPIPIPIPIPIRSPICLCTHYQRTPALWSVCLPNSITDRVRSRHSPPATWPFGWHGSVLMGSALRPDVVRNRPTAADAVQRNWEMEMEIMLLLEPGALIEEPATGVHTYMLSSLCSRGGKLSLNILSRVSKD